MDEKCRCEQGDNYHWSIVRVGTMWQEECLGCRRIVDFGDTVPDHHQRLYRELRFKALASIYDQIILKNVRESDPKEVRIDDE